MNVFDFIRFDRQTPPSVPPEGQVDLKFDPDAGSFVMVNPDGTTAPVGEGGTAEVTAEAVNEALEESPSVSRSALQLGSDLVINQGGLLPLWKALLPLQTANPTASTWVPVWGMGDSIGTGNGPTKYINDALMSRYGVGGIVSGILSSTTAITGAQLGMTFGGSAALHPVGYDGTADFTYWLNGRYVVLDDEDFVTESLVDANTVVGWSKIKLLFGYRTGGGSLSFDVKLDGATISGGAVAADTVATGPNPNGTIGSVEIDISDGLKNHGVLSIVTTASTAECHYLGCIVYLEHGGIIPIQSGCGSQTFVAQATTPLENWTRMAAIIGPALTITGSKGETEAGITAHVENLVEYFPASSHILLGNTPTAAADQTTERADNDLYRDLALQNGLVFINGYDFCQSYAYLVAQGLNGDGIHLSTDFNRIYGSFVGQEIARLSAPAVAATFSGDRLMTFNEYRLRTQVCDTKIHFPLTSDASDSTAGTGYTITKTQGHHRLAWTTSAGADTTEGIRSREFHRLSGDATVMYGFGLLENFSAVDNVSIRLGFGVNDIPAITPAGAGLFWEFGFDSSTLPWVKFLIYSSVAGALLESDKHYIPIATGATGYKTGGADPHHWAIRMDGFNTVNKRLRCWVCPMISGNQAVATEKPMLVCDTIITTSNVLGFSPPVSQPNIAFQAIVRTSSPASNGNASLTYLWCDPNPEDNSAFRNR